MKFNRKNIITNVIDLIPVIGSVKMILEGINGEQYISHKKIIGRSRELYSISGLIFLFLDITGLGAIMSDLGKGIIKLGEHFTLKKIELAIERDLVEKEGAKFVASSHNNNDKS